MEYKVSRRFNSLSLSIFCILCGAAYGDDEVQDKVALDLGYLRFWDSNHSRTPEPESEVIDTSTIGLTLKHGFARQNFTARIGASRYQHEEADYLDATTYDGKVIWQGQWGRRLSSVLSWARDDRLAERDEFPGNDVISLEESTAEFGYAINPRLDYVVLARDVKQSHSNEQRQIYDFDEALVETGLRFESHKGSTLSFLIRGGSREYPNTEANGGAPPVPITEPIPDPDSDIEPDPELLPFYDLDFDYGRVSLGGEWKASEKTSFFGAVDYFDRSGGINDGNGTDANLGMRWQASPKTSLLLDYLYRQPARGEDSENPSETQRLNMSFDWQMSERIALGSRVSLVEQEFAQTTSQAERDESKVRWQPLLLSYKIASSFRVELSGEWMRRRSPLESREYRGHGVAMGVSASF